MLSVFTLFAFTGIISALSIPQLPPQHQPSPHPPLVHFPRGASMPTLENYTATYLRNLAIAPPQPCILSYIGGATFPETTSGPNATQCAEQCAWINGLYSHGDLGQKCRFINVYMLFQNGKNKGMQCAMYDRHWGNEFAKNNGSLDGKGLVRTGLDVKSGDTWAISDSFAYWLTEDPGVGQCAGTSTGAPASPSSTSTSTSTLNAGAMGMGSGSAPSYLIGDPLLIWPTSTVGLTGSTGTAKPTIMTTTPAQCMLSTLSTSTTKAAVKATAVGTGAFLIPTVSRRDEGPHWGSIGSSPA